MPDTIHNIILLLSTLIDFYAYYFFLNHKFTFRFPKKYKILLHILLFAIYLLGYYSADLFPGMPLKGVFLVLFFAGWSILYTSPKYLHIIATISTFFAIVVCELIVIPPVLFLTQKDLSQISNDLFLQTIGTLSSRVLIIIVLHLLLRTRKRIFSGFIRDYFLIILVCVCYTLTITSLFYNENIYISTDTAIVLSLLVMFLVSALALYLLQKITKKSEEIMTTNLKLQQIEMEHKQNQDMTIVVEDLRTLRHDMNNHMSVLQGLLSMGEYQDAKDYLSTITSELDVANSFVFTDNKVLSVLMNHKAAKARQAGITFDTEIMTSVTPFSDSDLCALLGNILENAIEASTGHENPYIFFSIKKENGRLLITCDNTFTIPPVFEKGTLVTTKADKAYHGIGTKTIRSIVENYQGTVSFAADDMFHIRAEVPLSL